MQGTTISAQSGKISSQLYTTGRMAVWSKLLRLKDAEAGTFTLARLEINEAS
jgi:hypothetical protein